MVKEWRKWAEGICRTVKEILPEAEAYVIGSVARGDAVAASDVDLLIVLLEVPERAPGKSRDSGRDRRQIRPPMGWTSIRVPSSHKGEGKSLA